MNQQEIERKLDKLLKKTETDLERVFHLRLKSILSQLATMFRKYSKKGELSFTDLNKYNRFQKEMDIIGKQLTEDYRVIIKELQKSLEYQYVEKYLQNAYLFEVTAATEMGFTIPTVAQIRQAILNPVAKLTLPKIFEPHRNDIVRKINIEISQGLIAGEGYATIAKRIENAVGFSSKKARLVARTEVGRVRSLAAVESAKVASEHAKMTPVWMSSLDMRVRQAHRFLDGKEADKDGYFHYKHMKAKGPRLWGVASMDIQCRCITIHKVNGKLPEVRRGRDYNDDKYQHKLSDRIDELMADEGLTFLQAFNKANKEIQPPSRVAPYVTYQEWYDSMLN